MLGERFNFGESWTFPALLSIYLLCRSLERPFQVFVALWETLLPQFGRTANAILCANEARNFPPENVFPLVFARSLEYTPQNFFSPQIRREKVLHGPINRIGRGSEESARL